MDGEASEKSSVLFKDTELISGQAKTPQIKQTASNIIIPDTALHVIMVYCNMSLNLQESRSFHLI